MIQSIANGLGREPEGRTSTRLLAALVCATGLALVGAPACAADKEELRASMQSIFGSMQVLLPLSVDDDAFADPAYRERIATALANLSLRAGEVAGHAKSDEDRRIHFLAGSLEREAQETEKRFLDGETEGAQFFVQRLADFCVACHSGLPSRSDSPLAVDFVDESQLKSLPPDRRALLQVATRRFDDALTTWEAWFASTSVHIAELLDPLTDYLTVAIRVKNDLERPVPTLEKLADRKDIWAHLRGDLHEWVATLKAHAKLDERAPSLANARRTLEEARAVIQFPSDRRALVHYLLASSELHRWIEANESAGSADLAEAYYWLGLVETRINGNYWVSESDFYLETAVRLAPRSDVGRRAFALLEEETLLGWTGSAGTLIPSDVSERLAELRALTEGE
ncbi:MAG: hypothetical protein ACQGVK_17300 [Myxococcota bacterium]